MNTWVTGDNLTNSSDAIVDTSQLAPASYQTFGDAKAAYGSLTITGIQLVADGGWMFVDGLQTVVVDNVDINGTIFTFESTSTCKDNGWQLYGDTFKNQGDCVSFYATAKNS